MILILGSRNFYQVGKVIDSLESKGANFKVLDLTSDEVINIEISSGSDSFMKINQLCEDQPRVVWRTTKFIFNDFGDTDDWIDEYTCMSIKKSTNYSILPLLQGKILNPLSVSTHSENKLLHLKIAKDSGFSIPDTIVSNEISKIINWKKGRSCIIKSLGSSHFPYLKDGVKQKSFPTVELQESYLELNPNKIEPFPIYIQEKINKKFEYRVIYVNGNIFSFQIDPFQHKIMNTDYRLGGGMVEYKPISLPDTINLKIKSFAEKINVFSGCIDLIEDTNGNFVFLEINPDGVWGHHDKILNGLISETIADCLISLDQ